MDHRAHKILALESIYCSNVALFKKREIGREESLSTTPALVLRTAEWIQPRKKTAVAKDVQPLLF